MRGRIFIGLLFVPLCAATEGQKAARDLTEASLEDLMNIEVTTVSKKLQKLAQAPAAVYVITHEDMRRSGATHIPDLLRMVPGASNWNVTERWRLIPSYTWLRLDMRLSPRHQVRFRSNLDVSRRLQLDASVFYTGVLAAIPIPAYSRVDTRLGYRPKSDIEISLVGQNLQGGSLQEFVPAGPYSRSSAGRSLMVKLTWGI